MDDYADFIDFDDGEQQSLTEQDERAEAEDDE